MGSKKEEKRNEQTKRKSNLAGRGAWACSPPHPKRNEAKEEKKATKKRKAKEKTSHGEVVRCAYSHILRAQAADVFLKK
jgi:hypothetical protein